MDVVLQGASGVFFCWPITGLLVYKNTTITTDIWKNINIKTYKYLIDIKNWGVTKL